MTFPDFLQEAYRMLVNQGGCFTCIQKGGRDREIIANAIPLIKWVHYVSDTSMKGALCSGDSSNKG